MFENKKIRYAKTSYTAEQIEDVYRGFKNNAPTIDIVRATGLRVEQVHYLAYAIRKAGIKLPRKKKKATGLKALILKTLKGK